MAPEAFVGAVLAETEDAWSADFTALGGEYRKPKLVLFSGAVDSGCGVAESGRRARSTARRTRGVYIDLTFFDELRPSSARAAISRAPMSSRMRSATTCRTCSASRTRCRSMRQRVGEVEAQPALRAARAAGRLLMPASGETRRQAQASSSRATSRRHCVPRAPSATIACNAAPGARSCPIPSRTAAPSSAALVRHRVQDRLRRVLRHLQGGRSLIVHKHPVPAGICRARGRQGRGLRSLYAESIRDPEGFWARIAKRIDWMRAPTQDQGRLLRPGGLPHPLVRGRRAERLRQLPRPPARRSAATRPRSSSRATIPPSRAASPIASCTSTSAASAMRCAGSA